MAFGGFAPPEGLARVIYSHCLCYSAQNAMKDDYRAYLCHFNGSELDHQRQDSNVLL